MERRERYFSDQIAADEADLAEQKAQGRSTDESMVRLEESIDQGPSSKEYKGMNELETHFEELEKDIIQMTQNRTMLEKNFNELVELRHVLQKDTSFFDETIDVEKVDQSGENLSIS